MFCNHCGSKNPDGALFCNACGQQVVASASGSAPMPRPSASSHGGSHSTPGSAPNPASSPVGSSNPGGATPVTSNVVGSNGLRGAGNPAPEVEVWNGCMDWRGALTGWWLLACVLLIGLPFYALLLLKKRSVHYRLTNERLTITRGLFSRESEDLVWVRVEDVEYRQTLLQRLLGVGTLRILSTDKSTPELLLEGMPNPAAFKEQIWSLVRDRRRGTLVTEVLNT